MENAAISNLCKEFIKIINIIMYWENNKLDFDTRHKILNKFLKEFLLYQEVIDLSCLVIIQEKIMIKENIYMNLLQELLNKIVEINRSKSSKKKMIHSVENIFEKFYSRESCFLEKYDAGDMAEFVKWIYC
jgi:hypothetical protein